MRAVVNGTSFDTYSAVRSLESVGVETRQAEVIVEAIRNGQGDLATKADITAVRAELSIIRWVVGIQSAITLATFAIVAARLL